MDLKLAHSNELDDVYKKQLEDSISDFSPTLLENDIWDREFVLSIPVFVNEWVGRDSPLLFNKIPYLLKLELKLFWANTLSDERNNSRSIIERRYCVLNWLNDKGASVLLHFNASSLSQIPHPEFVEKTALNAKRKRQHNQELLELFDLYVGNFSQQKVPSISAGEVRILSYKSPRISIAGGFHKSIIIQKERFSPLNKRNVIQLNDLFSEENTRFKDKQR